MLIEIPTPEYDDMNPSTEQITNNLSNLLVESRQTTDDWESSCIWNVFWNSVIGYDIDRCLRKVSNRIMKSNTYVYPYSQEDSDHPDFIL